jgi:glycosyltransferase involved in cell wall biosynthesis
VKILFSSHFFPPGIGGIEVVSEILAGEFTRAGHEVIVVTQTGQTAEFPYEVRRRPGAAELVRLTRWSDVVFHNNISLRTAWPLVAVRRPWVVAHQTWMTRTDGRVAAVDRVKRWAIRHARNIAPSRAVAAQIEPGAWVIPNPYRAEIFPTVGEGGAREGDVAFAGRMVSDKGADLLVEALGELKARGLELRVTMSGDGPERAGLERRAAELGLEVRFTGSLSGADMAAMLRRNRVLVVPSRWQEPFGVIALEGIACGCVPLVANSGGLPEAVGEAGETFGTTSAELAERLALRVRDERWLAAMRAKAPAHLAVHTPAAVAGRYLKVIEEAACS